MEATIRQIFKEPEKYLDGEVLIEGWIRTLRFSKKFGFMEVNDGTFFTNLQVVINEELENFKELGKLPISSSVMVKGK